MLVGDELSVAESCLQSPSGQRQRPRSPVKLTPLQKKERYRQRQRDQAQRRLQAIRERDAQATALLLRQRESSQWHRQERQEEELILRRLERDLVDVQRGHPAAAGYRFSSRRDARDVAKSSPVFLRYTRAVCPESQVLSLSTKGPPSSVLHPAFTGFCVSRDNDSAAISPVFFLMGYTKIPLDEVDIHDVEGEDVHDDSEDSGDDMQTQEQFLSRQQTHHGLTAAHTATITRLPLSEQLDLQAILRARVGDDAEKKCLVCYSRSAIGCPGCFEFSFTKYDKIQSAKSTQRVKTPKTHGQELEEREARHTALRLKLMGYRRRSKEDAIDVISNDITNEKISRPQTIGQHEYYVNVLADVHAIRKQRSIRRNYVVLHIKTLPVGNLITLKVDIRSTVAYVYELYRSNVDSPNRKIHLLLPTTVGLFYLNEQIEVATDTRCGLVNGEFLIEDFHLYGDSEERPTSPLAKRNPLRDSANRTIAPEFMLFSVAILSESNTPKLVTNFLQQNFHFDEEEEMIHTVPAAGLRVEYATARLPRRAIWRDAYQQRLVTHVHKMKAFSRVSKQLERLEQERERERLLWIAYQERKLARLEQKQRQNRLAQGDGHRKRKVVRAIAYLDYILESTSNPRRPGVWEERLEKLWQCAQLFEEWKLCKQGRLIEAENTADTRHLVQRHLEATTGAFDCLLERGTGSGPLVFPIQCIGSSGSQQRLVVKIGIRLGCAAEDNHNYGLVLDLNQDFAALTASVTFVGDAERQKMKSRGFTRKQLLALNDEQVKRNELASSWRCADLEWKSRPSGDSQSSLLFAASDLVRYPFLQFPWHLVVQAYKQVLQSIVFQLAKLDEYNAFARVLQQEDAQLGRNEIEKWSGDVQKFEAALTELADNGNSPLLKSSALMRATRRVLAKKGVSLLKKRLRQRRQKMREREQELERLRLLQEENKKPKKSVVEILKEHFIKEKAPKINAVLEPTPAERLLHKAEQLLGAVASKATTVAQAAKKEYNVRAL